jgi:hypothetical protein
VAGAQRAVDDDVVGLDDDALAPNGIGDFLLERLQRLERQVGAVVAGGERDTAGAASAAVLPSRQVFRKSLRGVKQSVVISKLGSIVAIWVDRTIVDRELTASPRRVQRPRTAPDGPEA